MTPAEEYMLRLLGQKPDLGIGSIPAGVRAVYLDLALVGTGTTRLCAVSLDATELEAPDTDSTNVRSSA